METDHNSVVMKIRGHLIFTAVALLGCGNFVLCGTFGGKSADEAGLIAAGVAGFVALAHMLLALCHPTMLRPRHGLVLLLAIASPFAFLLPVFARPENGWPVNPAKGPRAHGKVHSRVVAPGDTVSMSWTADELKAVGGLWRGTPKIKVGNASELGCAASLAATGKNDTWDSVIWTDPGLTSISPFLTAEFHIPADQSLAGKSLKLQTRLAINYPSPESRSSFTDERTIVTRFDNVLLASPEVKQLYWMWWSWGATIGLTSTILAGLMLAIFASDHQASTASSQQGSCPWRIGSATSVH